jgi:hypothetical protein
MTLEANLEYISLFVDNDSIKNGFGKSVKASQTILNWATDLKIFAGYLASTAGFPKDYSLLIPDFWHITHGDAKCLPKEEAEKLWDSTVVAREAAKPFIESTEMVLKPFPGTKFHLKNIVPYETI